MIPAASEYPERTVTTQRRALAWQIIGVANMMTNHGMSIEAIVRENAHWLDEKEAKALTKIAITIDALDVNMRKLSKRLGVEQ